MARYFGVLQFLFFLLCFLASSVKIFSLPLEIFRFWVRDTQLCGRVLDQLLQATGLIPSTERHLDPKQGCLIFEELR